MSKSDHRVLKARKVLLEDRYRCNIEERQRRLELAQHNLDLAQERVRKAVVVAPHAGIVLTSRTEELVGTKAVEGEVILRIGDLTRLVFRSAVSESDISKVVPGHEARVYLTAFPHRRYKVFGGEVVSVSSAATQTAGGSVFEVDVALDEPWVEVAGSRQSLKPGLTGRVKIVIEPDVRLITRLLESISM